MILQSIAKGRFATGLSKNTDSLSTLQDIKFQSNVFEESLTCCIKATPWTKTKIQKAAGLSSSEAVQHGRQLRHEQGRQCRAHRGLRGEYEVGQVGPDVGQLLLPGLPADVLVAAQHGHDQGGPQRLHGGTCQRTSKLSLLSEEGQWHACQPSDAI